MRASDAPGVDVLWTPSELEAVDLDGRPAAVIDVIRASTTILVALEAGAKAVVPAASEEEAIRIAGSGEPGTLLCGERGGRRIPGFDLGNSPREYRRARISGRTLVFRTSNGTAAVRAAAGARPLCLASFRNLGAVARRLGRAPGDPVVVCAGRGGRMGADDVLCAGMLVDRLVGAGGKGRLLGDGARTARRLARWTGPPDASVLRTTDAGAAVAEIGLGADLEVCAAVDASRRVPVLRDGRLVLDDGGDHGD